MNRRQLFEQTAPEVSDHRKALRDATLITAASSRLFSLNTHNVDLDRVGAWDHCTSSLRVVPGDSETLIAAVGSALCGVLHFELESIELAEDTRRRLTLRHAIPYLLFVLLSRFWW